MNRSQAPADATDTARPVLVALANPRSARSLMRVGLVMAAARGSPLLVVSVVPVSGGQAAQTPALRGLRVVLHRMVELAAGSGRVVIPIMRAARGVVEGLTDVVREEGAGLLVVGWPPVDTLAADGLGPVGLLGVTPPCDLLIVRGRITPRWSKVMLARRGGEHSGLAGEVALDLARAGGVKEPHKTAPMADGGQTLLTALHVVPDYLSAAQVALEEAAFSAYWTRQEPVPTRPRVVQAAATAAAIIHESRTQDVLVLDAAPTARPYPFPLGRGAHEVIAGARTTVLVAKTAPRPALAYGRPVSSVSLSAERKDSGALPTVDRWFAEHTFGGREFSNTTELAALKMRLATTVSVVLLTFDDEETIGPLIRVLRDELGPGGARLIDELLMIDDGSGDHTLALARGLGITAVDSRELLRSAGSYRGRGETLWKALSLASGDLVVFLNPAVTAGATRAVGALLGPLLHDEHLHLVTGFTRRVLRGNPPATEVAAETIVRPLLNLFFPDLTGLISPLPGDFAARRAILRGLPIVTGEGVELGLLLDVVRHHGLEALAQVDLEARSARGYEPHSGSRVAFALAQTLMRRLDARHADVQLLGPIHHVLRLPYLQDERYGLASTDVLEIERPPLDHYLGR